MKMHELQKASGMTPLGRNILISMVKVEEKTEGGIIIPEKQRARMELGGVKAELLAIGEYAFADMHIKPEVGDMIGIAKHAGLVYDGVDGEDYRIADDEDVVAVYKVFDPEKELENVRTAD